MLKTLLSFICFALITSSSHAASANINHEIQSLLYKHYQHYHEQEYFSAIALSISLPKQPTQNYYLGRSSHDKNSKPITSDNLFAIGSLTKAYTSVLILKLAAQNKLKLSDTVGDYLPQYKKWTHIKIDQLLNMSSGLPNYSDTPTWNYLEAKHPKKSWKKKDLIDFVYPRENFKPPMKEKYFYTNTGYLLAAMIIEKVTGRPFKAVLEKEALQPLSLKDTFYPVPKFKKSTLNRLVHGYNYNQYDNPALLGKDLHKNNLTWGGAAGGIVASMEDVIKWVRALFESSTFLTDQQRRALTQMVSLNTPDAKPITETSEKNPKGFGLGVIQAYSKQMGRYWYYEGETLSFRTFYIYVPCNKIIIAASYNSATNSENDHGHTLLQSVYKQILQDFPQYQCKISNK